MSKRTIFTNITPLPSYVTRETVIEMLHDHDSMIELNPLVIEHHPIPPPKNAPAEEFAKCVWQQLTDRVQYLPGGLVSSKVAYNASFYDLPYGLQTHIYAPLGLDIKGKWSVGGSLPGEPRVKEELGMKLPREGLYLREDCDMKCNILMTGFVKKTLQKAHEVLVARLMARSEVVEDMAHNERMSMRASSIFPRSPTLASLAPSRFSTAAASYVSISPTITQEEWRRPSTLSEEIPPEKAPAVYELADETTPAELYSDPGYNNPALHKYESQRKANPFQSSPFQGNVEPLRQE